MRTIRFRKVFKDRGDRLYYLHYEILKNTWNWNPYHLLSELTDPYKYQFVGQDLYIFTDDEGNDVYENDIVYQGRYKEKVWIKPEYVYGSNIYGWFFDTIDMNIVDRKDWPVKKVGTKYEEEIEKRETHLRKPRDIKFRTIYKNHENGKIEFMENCIPSNKYPYFEIKGLTGKLISQDLYVITDINGRNIYENDIIKKSNEEELGYYEYYLCANELLIKPEYTDGTSFSVYYDEATNGMKGKNKNFYGWNFGMFDPKYGFEKIETFIKEEKDE